MPFLLSVLSGPSRTGVAFWTTPEDPTGLYSPVGRIVVLVCLLASLVVTLRWWWNNRRRR